LKAASLDIAAASAAQRPHCLTRPDPEAEDYALRAAVAGRRAQPRSLQIERAGRVIDLDVKATPIPQEPPLSWKRLEGGFGYIRISTFGDEKMVEAWDQALAELRESRGLILDARRNGGGDTAIARPMMGRLIKTRTRYAYMRRREGRGLSQPWQEFVEPRGPFTYEAPVVVLTDRWSASMAEGFPMGLHGMGRARVVGTPMMQLGAAVFPCLLDRTAVNTQYSAEPVYDAKDRPRWLMRPDVEVAPSATGEDVILAAGLRELERIAA
jgi:carboxyl-terminal processing protease